MIEKKRVELFSDAVIAIVATITVLEIPFDKLNYSTLPFFLHSIMIFLVSFLIIMNFWNNQRILLNKINDISERYIWRNIFWLAFLALLPIFTMCMMNATDYNEQVLATVGYGIVNLLTNIMFRSTIYAANETKLNEIRTNTFFDIILIRNGISIIAIIFNTILALFYPAVAIFLFLGIPLIGAIHNLWEQKEKKRRNRKPLALKNNTA